MLERVRQKCDDEEFDFLHFHLDYYPFSLFSRQPTPFVTHPARQARSARTPTRVHDIFIDSGDFNLERAAPSGAASQLGSYHPPRPAGDTADAAAGDPRLPGGTRPDRPGKGRRPRDQDCDPVRHSTQDCRQGRPGRPGVLRRTDSPADREQSSRRLISAKSATTRNRTSSAARSGCSFPSTGRSRSASS